MKRRVYAPDKPCKPGMFEVWVFLKSGRGYVWKGRAANHDVADKLAMKRLNGNTSQMRMTTRVRD